MSEVVVRHAKREEDDEQLGLCMHIKDYSIVSRSLCLARFVDTPALFTPTEHIKQPPIWSVQRFELDLFVCAGD